jgi:UDP-glucose 4-epimerase
VKAVVFGGSGFVGSHVADALTAAGHDVLVADLRPSRYLREDQQFAQVDILDREQALGAVDGAGAVYNLAGIADIGDARGRPVDTVRVNVLGNAQLLEACRRAGVGRFVLASTIYVYSDRGSFYRTSKQACELYVEEYQREFGLDYTIVRYGTLYGPRATETNSVTRYLTQALRDRRMVAHGTGDEIREYIHVEDAARLSVEILADEFRNEQVILTGAQRMRFRDLLALIREIVGDDVEIEYVAPGATPGEAAEAGHYAITPYVFRPRVGRKLVDRLTMDMGQGLVECLREIYEHDVSGVER